MFLRLQVYERVGISLVGAYDKVDKSNLSGKFVIWVCERDKGLKDEFYSFIKSKERSIFVIDSYLKDSAFTAVKRDTKF